MPFAGLVLALPTLLLRGRGIQIDVDGTLQQLAMVALFTSVGSSLRLGKRGGRAVGALLSGGLLVRCHHAEAWWAYNAGPLPGHPSALRYRGRRRGFCGSALPPRSRSGPRSKQSRRPRRRIPVAVAMAVSGILIGGFTTGALRAFLIRKDGLRAGAESSESATEPKAHPREAASERVHARTCLFGLAVGRRLSAQPCLELLRLRRRIADRFAGLCGRRWCRAFHDPVMDG